MKRVPLCAALIWLTAISPLWAATAKPFQRGEIVSVEQKSRSRVLYYLVNTPVTQEDPYYELSVKINKTIYVGEFSPRHSRDTLPESWSSGAEVQVRLDKRHFFVKTPGDDEIDFAMIKRLRADQYSETPAN